MLVHQYYLVRLAAEIQLAQISRKLARLGGVGGIARGVEGLFHGDAGGRNDLPAPAAADDEEAVLTLRQLLKILDEGAVVHAAESAVSDEQDIAYSLALVGHKQRAFRSGGGCRDMREHPAARIRKGAERRHGILSPSQLGGRHHFHGFGYLPCALNALYACSDGAHICHTLCLPSAKFHLKSFLNSVMTERSFSSCSALSFLPVII